MLKLYLFWNQSQSYDVTVGK